jgi:hypothetical protein
MFQRCCRVTICCKVRIIIQALEPSLMSGGGIRHIPAPKILSWRNYTRYDNYQPGIELLEIEENRAKTHQVGYMCRCSARILSCELVVFPSSESIRNPIPSIKCLKDNGYCALAAFLEETCHLASSTYSSSITVALFRPLIHHEVFQS